MAPTRSVSHPRAAARRVARRGQARLPPAGQAEPPRRRPARRRCRASWRSRRPTSSSSMAGRPVRPPATAGRRAGRGTRPGRADATRRAYGAVAAGATGRATAAAAPARRGAPGRAGSRRGAGAACARRRPGRTTGRPAVGPTGGSRTARRRHTDATPEYADRAARPEYRHGRRRRRPPSRRAGATGPSTARARRPGRRASRRAARQGDARLDVVRRADDEPFEPDWARRQLVRHDERHVLDAQPEGVRRPAQARTGVPGTGARRAPADRPSRTPEPADAPDVRRTETDDRADRPAASAASGEVRPRIRSRAPADAPTGAGPGGDRPPRPAGAEWSATPGSIDDGTATAAVQRAPARPGGRRPPPGDDDGSARRRSSRGAVLAEPRADRSIRGSRDARWRASRWPLVGWLPIALGLGWLLGEMTGCGRFAATCDGSADRGRAGSSRPRSSAVARCWFPPSLASLADDGAPVAARRRGRRPRSSCRDRRRARTADARGARPRRRAADRLARRCRHRGQTSAGRELSAPARSRILRPCPARHDPRDLSPRPRSTCSRCG